MRRIALNVFLPLLAVAGVAFFMAYPKPTDTNLIISDTAMQTAVPEAKEKASYVRSLFDAHATYTPALSVSLDRVQGCLVDLADASVERREQCGPLILDALTAIELAERGRGSMNLPDPAPDTGTIQSQIAVAAIDLCRTDWLMARDSRVVPNTAICEVANVQLVSMPENQ